MFFYHFKECCCSLVYVKRCMQILASVLKCDFLLQQPLKRQTQRNISIFNKLLYDVCELQNSVNEMLLSTTPFVSSFFDDLEISSLCNMSHLGYKPWKCSPPRAQWKGNLWLLSSYHVSNCETNVMYVMMSCKYDREMSLSKSFTVWFILKTNLPVCISILKMSVLILMI